MFFSECLSRYHHVYCTLLCVCVCVCSVRYQGCCVVSRPCMCLYCWCSKSVVPQKFMVQLYGALFPFPDCVSRSVRFFSLVNCEKGRPHLVGHFLVMGSIRSREYRWKNTGFPSVYILECQLNWPHNGIALQKSFAWQRLPYSKPVSYFASFLGF